MTTSGGIVSLALLSDSARVFRQLGVESVRASVVNLSSLALRSSWSISDLGEVDDDHGPERALESAFPGAANTVAQLSQITSGETLVQRLSPRLWLLSWRLDNLHAVVAEARYRESHAVLGDVDLALMRLVCNTGIRVRSGEAPIASEEPHGLGWPMVDRRQRAKATPKRLAALLLCAVSVLAALWLAFVAVPGLKRGIGTQATELARLREQADQHLQRALAVALSTGDYGEVQQVLSGFETVGQLQRAVVLNAEHKNVAMVGAADGLLVGKTVSAEVSSSARAIELRLGSQQYGQLLVLDAPAAGTAHWPVDDIRLAALLALLSSAAAGALLAVRKGASVRR